MTSPDFTEHILLLIYAMDNKIVLTSFLIMANDNTIIFAHLMFLINC